MSFPWIISVTVEVYSDTTRFWFIGHPSNHLFLTFFVFFYVNFVIRTLAMSFTRVEIQSGSQCSYWFNMWCPLGRLFDITGRWDVLILEYTLMQLVEHAVQSCRSRKHRVTHLLSIESEILKLRGMGLTQAKEEDDLEKLWQLGLLQEDEYKLCF